MTTLSRDTRRFNIWTRLNPADLVDRTRALPLHPRRFRCRHEEERQEVSRRG